MERTRSKENIELRIEGHTDLCGMEKEEQITDTYEILSCHQDVQTFVYSYIFNNCNLSPEQKEFAQKQVISVGYSFSDRVQNNNIYDVSLDPMSRRIEFRIISK